MRYRDRRTTNMPPSSPRNKFVQTDVRTKVRTESCSSLARCSEINFVAARFTPMSRKLKYPITTHARENKPNEVSPQDETSLGIANSSTKNVQPSAAKFSTALRASNEVGVSCLTGALVCRCSSGASISAIAMLVDLLTRKLGGLWLALALVLRAIRARHSDPQLMTCSLNTRTIWCSPWHSSIESSDYILDKHFFWVLRGYTIPARFSENEQSRTSTTQECSQKHNRQPRRERLSLRHVGWVENLDAGNLFGFRDLGQFVLLREAFENCFLDSATAIEVGVRYPEKGQLTNRGIQFIALRVSSLLCDLLL